MLIYKKWDKYLAIISHLGLSSVWTLSIIYTRVFNPSMLKDIIWLQASFVFYSFLFSFGFSTLIRMLLYDKKIAVIKSLLIQYLGVQALLALLSLPFKTEFFYVVSMAAIYNSVFVLLNLSIAIKSYRYSVFYSFVIVVAMLGGIFCHLYGWGYLFKVQSFLVIVIFLVFFYFHEKNRFKILKRYNALSREGFKEVVVGPLLLVSTFPLRIAIFLVGGFFGGSYASTAETAAYADMLIYFGLISVVAGRFFLFNERQVKAVASTGVLRFAIYQVVIIIPFFIYACFMLDVSPLVSFLISLLYSSREIYGLHVNFSSKTQRLVMVLAFSGSVGVSWIMLKVWPSFYTLAPVCLFVTVYYLSVQPLTRETNGNNT